MRIVCGMHIKYNRPKTLTRPRHSQNRKYIRIGWNRKRKLKTNLCVYDPTMYTPLACTKLLMALSQQMAAGAAMQPVRHLLCQRATKRIERHFCFVIIMSALDLDPDLRYTHAYGTEQRERARTHSHDPCCTMLNIECAFIFDSIPMHELPSPPYDIPIN